MTEAINISLGKAILLDLIPTEQLEGMRDAHKDNPEVVEAINSHLEAKAKVEAETLALDNLVASLNSLELPTDVPSNIHNIFRPRINETRKLTKAEVKEVLSANPTLTEDDVSTRTKETGKTIWGLWTINKALSVGKASTSTISTRKLAITLNSREGSQITPVGNFRTSKEACLYLSLETAGDSARRVLEAHKYIVDDYDGTDFLVKEV